MNTYYIKRKKNLAELHITELTTDGVVLVDIEDVPLLSTTQWRIKLSVQNDETIQQYVYGKIDGKTISMHRYLTGAKKGDVIDHLNRNTLDNRRDNLQKADYFVNNLNASFSKNNTSGRTGVKFTIPKNGRSPKWVAQYNVNGRRFSKDFAVSVYGYERAYALALNFREQGEILNNIKTAKTCND
jgi:hypothetical protein